MRRATWLVLGIALGGCSTLSVSQDYDRNQDFSRFKTWAWAPLPPQADGASDPTQVSTLTHERIHRAVELEMKLKGYEQVDPTAANFWVKHYAIIEPQIRVAPGYDWGYDEVSSYDKGTVLIDFVNPKDKRMVWRGTASDVVDPDLTPAEREERIQEAVHEILAQFPPKKE